MKKRDGSQFKEEEFYPVKIIKKVSQQSDAEIEAVFTNALSMLQTAQKQKAKSKSKAQKKAPVKPVPVPVAKKKK